MKNRRIKNQGVSTPKEEQVMAPFDAYVHAKCVSRMIIESDANNSSLIKPTGMGSTYFNPLHEGYTKE